MSLPRYGKKDQLRLRLRQVEEAIGALEFALACCLQLTNQPGFLELCEHASNLPHCDFERIIRDREIVTRSGEHLNAPLDQGDDASLLHDKMPGETRRILDPTHPRPVPSLRPVLRIMSCVRQDEVEARRRMRAASRANALVRIAVEEHRMALAAEAPSLLNWRRLLRPVTNS
jgi:hypothetical protein